MTLPDSTCLLCGTPYRKKKRNQKYCSPQCQQKAWPILNRTLHNQRHLSRRHTNPEWYRKKEPMYYRTYRAKALSSKPWKYLLQSRRLDAVKRSLVYELSDEWAIARWTGHCEISGLPFSKQGEGTGPHPMSPSIDRTDQSIGYTQNNCRFILWAINGMRGRGTDETMYMIAKAIVARMDINTAHSRQEETPQEPILLR
jgi:hypothetical protein